MILGRDRFWCRRLHHSTLRWLAVAPIVELFCGFLFSFGTALSNHVMSDHWKHSICGAVEYFVKDQMAGQDGSHDFAHVDRVRQMAIRLAKEEGLDPDSTLVVELSALLHDVGDYKYSGDDDAGPELIQAFLQSQNCPSHIIDRVISVVESIGFKHELENGRPQMTPELECVQDADRLDAIGAIGIARCFTFSGARNRPIHDGSFEPNNCDDPKTYGDKNRGTAINHFYEKLLLLKDKMNTPSGKRLAAGRHDFMKVFLQQFQGEMNAVV